MLAADASRTTAFSGTSIEEVDTVAFSELEQFGEQAALLGLFRTLWVGSYILFHTRTEIESFGSCA